MVEIIQLCDGTVPAHEWVATYPDPVDWSLVVATLRSTRCEAHPEYQTWDGYE